MYNRLFTKILDSSIWLEDHATRLVWITLLASKDQDHFAKFSAIGNLSRRAGVTDQECRVAVAKFEAPDPDSGDPDNDGRRIERVPGGWIVLNGSKYDDLATAADAREQTRERVKRHRERNAPVTVCNAPVTVCNEKVTPSDTTTTTTTGSDLDRGSVRIETNPEIEVPSVVCVPRKNRSATDLPYSAAFERFWKCYPNKTGKGKAWAAWQRIKPDLQLAGKFEDAIAWQVKTPQWMKDGGQFIPHAATWLNQKRWQDEPIRAVRKPSFDEVFDATMAAMGRRAN
jgi:hypothetical protein